MQFSQGIRFTLRGGGPDNLLEVAGLRNKLCRVTKKDFLLRVNAQGGHCHTLCLFVNEAVKINEDNTVLTL